MDSQRNLLLIALLFVTFMLWQAWETDKNPPATTQAIQQATNAVTGDATNQAYRLAVKAN